MATEPTIEAYLLEDRTFPPPDNIVKEARNYYPKVRAASEGLEIRL